jgi:hypothetical protein
MSGKHWFEYAEDWRGYPGAYWAHKNKNGAFWIYATEFDPPAPRPVPHKGYLVLCVETNGFVFRFSSPEQLADCLRVLAMKPLPTTRRLSALYGSGHGPNSHWLSRLPAKVKSPKARVAAVAALRAAAKILAGQWRER